MTKASAGYRALALGEAEPTHVVPLARFGGAPASAPPAPTAERFNFFRDRQGAANPARTLQDAIVKAPSAATESKPGFYGSEAAQAAPPLQAIDTPAPAELSPWSRDEMLPASVLFDMNGFNDVLRFLVDRFVLEKRRGDIFIHVRGNGSTAGEAPVLSFVEPAKSSLAAELIATLVAARRATGYEVTVVQPPEDHPDFAFWQKFARAE